MTDDRRNLPGRANDSPRRVQFGPYEADFHTQELRKHGSRLKLSGQPFQILDMLVSRPQELVTREELQNRLWAQNTFSDSNHGLNAAVNKLRDVLSDSADNPKYIETLPRRGYRFIAEIQALPLDLPSPSVTQSGRVAIPVTPPEPPPIIPPQVPPPQVLPTVTTSPRWSRMVFAATISFVVIAGVAGVLRFLASSIPTSTDARREGEYQTASHNPPAQLAAPEPAAPELEVWEPEAPSQRAATAQPRIVSASPTKLVAAPAIYREPGTLQPVTMRTIISGEGGNAAPQFSPDGKRIAFMSNRTGPWQIWVSDVDGSNARQLSFTDSAGTPRWSPDGRYIAFDAPSNDGTSIYVAAADSRGNERRLVEGLVPSFSRDGKWIYFASERSGDWQVWKIAATGGSPTQVTFGGGFAALESPDGYIYYSKSRFPDPEICRLPVAGGDESCVLPHLRPRTWSSWAVTREGVLFVENAPGGPVLSLYEPSKRQVRDLVSLRSAPFWMGASTDGKKVIMNDAEERQISMVEGLR